MATKAQATNGPRQRIAESAMEDCTLSTMGCAKHDKERGTVRTVVVMVEFPGKEGKQPIRMTTDAATQFIACLTASLGAALTARAGGN